MSADILGRLRAAVADLREAQINEPVIARRN